MLPREDRLAQWRMEPYRPQVAPMGKGVIDRDLRFVEVNETLASFDGTSIDASVGRVVSRAMPTLAPVLEPLLREVLASGKSLVDVDARNLTLAYNNDRHWRVSCFPVQTRSGMVLAVDVLVQEVTPASSGSLVSGRHSAMHWDTGEPLQLIVEVADWDNWEWNKQPNPPAEDEISKGLCNLAPGTFAGTFESFIALVYPDDRERIGQAIARASDDDTHYTIEFRIVRPNGTVRWLAANGCWVEQLPDKPPHLLGVVADITERKHAEAALEHLLDSEPSARTLMEQTAARRHQLYDLALLFSGALTAQQVANALVNHAIDALGASSGSVGLLTEDRSALELICVSDDVAGHEDDERVPMDAIAPFPEAVRSGTPNWLHSKLELMARYPCLPHATERYYAGASVHIPLRIHQRIIGGLALLFAAPRVFSDDDRTFALTLAEQCALALDRARLYDVERTARRVAEAARTRFAVLANASAALAVSLDYGATLTTVAQMLVPQIADYCLLHIIDENDVYQQVASAHVDPRKQPLLDAIRRLSRDEHHDPRSLFGTVVHTGEPLLVPMSSDQQVAESVDHTEKFQIYQALAPISFMIVPLIAREQTIGTVTLGVAESGRHYDEHDLALAQDLANRCALAVDNARLYAAEHTARTNAEAAVRARDEVVALVSHDLKNPLTAIRGRTYYAQRRLTATPPALDGVAKGLEMIGTLAERMSMQIEDLLDLAGLRAGATLELQRDSVGLVALVQQLATESRELSDQHRIIVASAVPELTGYFDALRLERVVRNLFDNALKYSPKGGVINVKVARETNATGDWAVLTVRDQGVGIPASDLPHIFERFHRASNVASRIAGTGLGLASVRQIIEQHGGTITVTSKVGKGTTFTIRLPLRQ